MHHTRRCLASVRCSIRPATSNTSLSSNSSKRNTGPQGLDESDASTRLKHQYCPIYKVDGPSNFLSLIQRFLEAFHFGRTISHRPPMHQTSNACCTKPAVFARHCHHHRHHQIWISLLPGIPSLRLTNPSRSLSRLSLREGVEKWEPRKDTPWERKAQAIRTQFSVAVPAAATDRFSRRLRTRRLHPRNQLNRPP